MFGLAVYQDGISRPMYSECETIEQARAGLESRFTKRLLAADVIICVVEYEEIIEKYNKNGLIEEPEEEIESSEEE